MEKSDLLHHYSQRFNEELEEIRTMVLAMGGMVERQLETAVGALVTGDVSGAERVVADDYKVNALDVQIDERCTLILARRQPTASDLRLVLAVIKTTADLERIGDEAKRVARMAVRLGTADHARSLFLEVEHMGSLSRVLLNKALDAYARMDVEAALDVAKEDQRVDREYENVMRQAITYMMEDPRSIPFVLDIIWSARALERIGDRCRNISEYVIYLVKGKDVRHTSLEKIEQEIIRR
jgi:phosphate transport system protein